MSEREQAKQIIDKLPEYKISNLLTFLQGMQFDDEMEDDLYCQKLYEDYLYCRPPGFTVVSLGKHLAGGLQSGCTANLTGAQYK